MDTALLSSPIDPAMAMSANAGNDAATRSQTIQNLAQGSQNDEQKRKKLREACEGFESVFIQKMWEQMRASLPKDGLMHSKEEDFWQGMYDQELGKAMASAGGIGLANMMMEQLDRNNQPLSEAGRTGSIRRMPMDVTPAPLLPSVPPQEHTEANTETATPASQPQTGLSAGSAAKGMYDGEAAGVAHMDQPVDTTMPVSAENEGQGSPQLAAEENSPLMRQTLDELAAHVAQNNPIAAQSLGLAQTAEPVITRTTYTTNLPPNERTLAPANSPASRASQRASQMPLTASVEGPGALLPPKASPAFYEDTHPVGAPSQADLLAQPNSAGPAAFAASAVSMSPVGYPQAPQAAAQPALNQKPGWPSPEKDILAGIRASYVPRSQQETTSMYAGVTQNAQTRIPTHAGGPRRPATPFVANPAAYGPDPAPEKGSLLTPLSGSIDSGFGWRLDPFTGQRAWHEGVDIKAADGQSVLAAKSGTVIFAGYDPELGNTIVLDHGDNLRTIYGHNKDLTVAAGQKIEQGTEIATAGSSGRAAGTHLHFEIRRGELSINPEPYISQGMGGTTPSVEAKVPLTSLS